MIHGKCQATRMLLRVHCAVLNARTRRFVTRSQSYGGHGERETPGHIPNPEAKPLSADGTAPGTGWESRTPPDNHSRRGPHHQVGAPSSYPMPGTFGTRSPHPRGTFGTKSPHPPGTFGVLRHARCIASSGSWATPTPPCARTAIMRAFPSSRAPESTTAMMRRPAARAADRNSTSTAGR